MNGAFHATNHGMFTKRQKGYLASLVDASMSWCGVTAADGILSHHDSAQYEIQVTAAKANSKGQWVATKISGRDTEYYPASGGCLASTLALDFDGQSSGT